MGDLLSLLLIALLGSVIALVGGLVFLYSTKLSKVLETNSVPFAAGVLVTVALLGLLPEAVELVGERTYLIILITFFGAYLFENIFFGIHHHDTHDHGKSYRSSVPLVIIGDTIHNLIDGVAIGASFLVAPGLAFVTAISTFLHEFPHEIVDFGILQKAGWKRNNIVAINVVSASTTIIGAFFVYFLIPSDSLIGALLAISAGIFLYLGASDFLPSIDKHSDSRIKTILPLVIGILIMVFVISIVPT